MLKIPVLTTLLVAFIAASTPAQQVSPSDHSEADIGQQSADLAAEDEPGERPDFGDYKLRRGAKEYAVEFGMAPMQPTFLSGRKEYDTAGRKFAMASFQFGRVIGTTKGVTFEYMFEVIPISFAIKNEVKNPDYISEKETPDTPKTVRTNTFSIGVQPAAFRFVFMPRRRLKPYVRLGAGFIFSSKPIPVPDSPSYNFAADFGGGLMYHLSRKRTINFGYRYFHISNMNIGEINPGYNANVFYVGYSFFSK